MKLTLGPMDICEVEHCEAQAAAIVTVIVGEVKLCLAHCRGILAIEDRIIPWQREPTEVRYIEHEL